MAIKSQEIEKQISALKWEVFTYRHKKVISPNLAYTSYDINEIQNLENAELRESVQNQIRTVVDEIILFDDHFQVNISNE